MKYVLYKFLIYALIGTLIFPLLAFSPERIWNGENNEIERLEVETNLLQETLNRYRRNTGDNSSLNSGSVTEFLYAEQFAGIWYCENDTLNVGVVNNINANTRNSEINYNIHRFSWNFLQRVNEAVVTIMPYHSITSTGVVARYNHVEVGITHERYMRGIVNVLNRKQLFTEGSINFVVNQNEAQPLSRPIHSGQQTGWHPVFSAGGTISAKAICNVTGRRGMITNAHVIPRERRAWQRNWLGDWEWVGTSVREQWQYGGEIDSTFIPFEDQNAWQHTSSASFWVRPLLTTYHIVVPRTYQITHQDEIIEGMRKLCFVQRY